MGYNISPIANHNLNTVNVKALAYDLISRLDVNIEYGYYGLSEYFQLLGSEMNDDFIKLGEITKDESFETYKLIDEKYQIKQLYEKFGDDIFYNPKYWIHFDCELPDEKTIIEEKKEVNHSIYSLELVSNKEFKYLTIYDHSFLNVIPYISKWWTFCRIFTDKYYEDKDFLLSLNDNRKELMYYTLKLGGNKIYYISDQSDVLKGVGQGDESEMNWSEFENYVFDKTSNFLLDIPKFFSDSVYRRKFHETNYFPLSFVDNFADLK